MYIIQASILHVMSILMLVPTVADKNRVILSGEFPDYIHAVSANVSHEIIVLYVWEPEQTGECGIPLEISCTSFVGLALTLPSGYGGRVQTLN